MPEVGQYLHQLHTEVQVLLLPEQLLHQVPAWNFQYIISVVDMPALPVELQLLLQLHHLLPVQLQLLLFQYDYTQLLALQLQLHQMRQRVLLHPMRRYVSVGQFIMRAACDSLTCLC